MNWSYRGREVKSLEDVPEEAFGFVYEVEDSQGKKYIGRKNLYTRRKRNFGKKEIAKLQDKRRKRYEYVTRESNWTTYNGSNKELNGKLKEGEVRLIRREILRFAYSKKELGYYEIKYQMARGVIEGDSYYNSNVSGKYYRKDLTINKEE